MSDRTLQFEKLSIQRVEKRIGHGEGFDLSGLSPGVNVVHGPNGSGKSTTALVMQELLWPGRTGMERPSIIGLCRDGANQWYIGLDAGHVECACNGVPCDILSLGPAEYRRRYRLALDELISSDDSDFAALIAKASQGGYDLSAAADALDYSSKSKSRKTERCLVHDRHAALEKARQRQRDIEADASKLVELREERNRAITAADNLGLLEKALEYRQADEKRRELMQQLESLPASIAKLRGDERDVLDSIATRLQQCDIDLALERTRIENAEVALRGLRLPPDGVLKETIVSVRARQRKLSAIETEIGQVEQALKKAEAEAAECQSRLGQKFTNEQLSQIQLVEVPELTSFARQVERTQALRASIAERHAWLKPKAAETIPPYTAEQIGSGMVALGNWLASPPVAARLPHQMSGAIIAVSALAIGFAIALAVLHHWIWLLSILIVVGTIAIDKWVGLRRLDSPKSNPRPVHRDNYDRTGLPALHGWDVPEVADSIRTLADMAAHRAREDDRLRRLEDLKTDFESFKQRLAELTSRQLELKKQLGLDIKISDEWLSLLVENICRWQKHYDEAIGLRSTLNDLEQQRDLLVREIGTALLPFGYSSIESSELAQAWIDDLEDRRSEHEKALADSSDAKRRIEETIEPNVQQAKDQRYEILHRLALDGNHENVLDEWLSERPTYLDLKEHLISLDAIRADRERLLADHRQLLQLSGAAIQIKIEEEKQLTDSRDQLSDEIGQISRAVDDAKRGHEVSSALDAYEEAIERLSDARHSNRSALVGSVLIEWVRHIASERSRPQVFRRANELLVKFTSGVLQLSLDDRSDSPIFLARCGSEPARPIEDLSLGERAQLLMAVRLAFLEQDEPVRLPLLLDEAFGTSDDGRTSLIIDTVVEIARQGRQVFYFTARKDEVCKWVARLESTDIPNAIIDLAKVRRIAISESNPLPRSNIDFDVLPSPDGSDYEEYGRTLQVPGLDPNSDTVDNVHLWHLLDNPNELHDYASKGIVIWSQLRTLKRYSLDGSTMQSEVAYERAAVAAKAVEAACDAWRVGRGKSVDRRVLQDSKCVTKNFIDELTDLAHRKNGSAPAIIAALENGEVPRWRSNNTDGLREYFEANGYLAPDVPLSNAALRARVIAAVFDDLNAGRINIEVIDRIVGSLPETCAAMDEENPVDRSIS